MGDLSGFGFVLGFSPHFPQSPAFLIQVKGTGEEEVDYTDLVFLFSAAMLAYEKAACPSHSWPQQQSRGWTFPTA